MLSTSPRYSYHDPQLSETPHPFAAFDTLISNFSSTPSSLDATNAVLAAQSAPNDSDDPEILFESRGIPIVSIQIQETGARFDALADSGASTSLIAAKHPVIDHLRAHHPSSFCRVRSDGRNWLQGISGEPVSIIKAVQFVASFPLYPELGDKLIRLYVSDQIHTHLVLIGIPTLDDTLLGTILFPRPSPGENPELDKLYARLESKSKTLTDQIAANAIELPRHLQASTLNLTSVAVSEVHPIFAFHPSFLSKFLDPTRDLFIAPSSAASTIAHSLPIGRGLFTNVDIAKNQNICLFDANGLWLSYDECLVQHLQGRGGYTLAGGLPGMYYFLWHQRDTCYASMANSPRRLRYITGRNTGKPVSANAKICWSPTYEVFYLKSTKPIKAASEIFPGYGSAFFSTTRIDLANPDNGPQPPIGYIDSQPDNLDDETPSANPPTNGNPPDEDFDFDDQPPAPLAPKPNPKPLQQSKLDVFFKPRQPPTESPNAADFQSDQPPSVNPIPPTDASNRLQDPPRPEPNRRQDPPRPESNRHTDHRSQANTPVTAQPVAADKSRTRPAQKPPPSRPAPFVAPKKSPIIDLTSDSSSAPPPRTLNTSRKPSAQPSTSAPPRARSTLAPQLHLSDAPYLHEYSPSFASVALAAFSTPTPLRRSPQASNLTSTASKLYSTPASSTPRSNTSEIIPISRKTVSSTLPTPPQSSRSQRRSLSPS